MTEDQASELLAGKAAQNALFQPFGMSPAVDHAELMVPQGQTTLQGEERVGWIEIPAHRVHCLPREVLEQVGVDDISGMEDDGGVGKEGFGKFFGQGKPFGCCGEMRIRQDSNKHVSVGSGAEGERVEIFNESLLLRQLRAVNALLIWMLTDSKYFSSSVLG